MKRIFIYTITLLVVATVFFYFWASQNTLPEAEYSTKVNYTYNYQKNPSDTFTVMTYNLGYLSGMTNNLPVNRSEELFKNNLYRAQMILEKVNPDIIGFQEIDFNASRSFHYNQLDSLADLSEYPVAMRSINWDKRYVPFPYWPISMHFGKVISGQAILSKAPLTPIETIVMPKPINASFIYNGFYLDRLIQVCQIEVGGQLVVVMNLHLEAFDEETRVLQAQIVRELYENYANNGPVLLVGDFNSELPAQSPEDAMNTILKSQYIVSAISPLQYESGAESLNTFPTSTPDKMIDYILFNSNYIQKIESRVVIESGEISDHFPVIMKFTFSQ